MSKIDDIWASMNLEVAPKKIPDFEKLQKTKKATKKKADMNDPAKILGSKKEKAQVVDVTEVSVAVESTEAVVAAEPIEISLSDLQPKLNKDINALSDGNQVVRKNGLQNLYRLVFVEHKLTTKDYSELFHDLSRPLFKRYADPVEKCRELSQRLTKAFFERCLDIVPVLGYYFPAVMQRIPPSLGYDEEMKVFIIDQEAHNAYKRGKAVARQDKAGNIGGQSTVVIETSEEIRYLTCDALLALLQRVHVIGAYPILHPYFEEIIIFLQLQLRDPYPELKMIACQAFEMLARIPDYEVGMKYYSVATCRAILPVLRHRHAKVRAAAVAALHMVMIVPDRAKRKGSGTEAIQDLVGFREENVLPIAAFYKDDVQVNHLAELVGDKSPQVREKLVEFFTSLLTVIDDRYDHQTRLLPYLLDLMTDELDPIAQNAYRCLQICGKQYEEEHTEEILEKRQYGIDGNDQINLEKSLPKPFTERPRIGMRMYVRGNSGRFLLALVNELTNWIAPTRLKSANLLKLVIVLCEEHTTMEMHAMLPQLMKALRFARDDKDTELQTELHAVFELLGRYILPEIYLYYILPRLRGDSNVQPFGADAETRVTALEMLGALLEGSKANTIVPFFQQLVQTLTDPFVISSDSIKQQAASMQVLRTILSVLQGKSKQAIEAYYVATGRITSLQVTIRQIFRYLLLQLSTKELREQAWQVLVLLSKLETDPVALQQKDIVSVARLFYLHGVTVLSEEIARYDIDAAWSVTLPEHQVLLRLLEFPAFVIQQDTRAVRMLLAFIVESMRSLRTLPATDGNPPVHNTGAAGSGIVIHEVGHTNTAGAMSIEVENEVARAMNTLLTMLLRPLLISPQSIVTSLAIQLDNSFAAIFAAGDKKGNTAVRSILSTLVSSDTNQTMDSRLHASLSMLQGEPVEDIIQTMVLSPRWSRHPQLNLCRMKLLNLILGMEREGEEDQDSDDDEENDRAGNSTVAELVHPTLLLRHAAAIAWNVSAVSLTPTTAEATRLDTIALLRYMLQQIRAFSGLTKVLPLRKLAIKLAQEEAVPDNSNSTAFVFATRQQYYDVKGSAQVSLLQCIKVLDDSSDEVRDLAIRTILENVQFLFACTEEMEEWKHRLSPPTSIYTAVHDSLSYDSIVRMLFTKAVIELDKVNPAHPLLVDRVTTQKYVDLVDMTLRTICIIHPGQFEQLIRVESAPILSRPREEITESISDFMNGLVNHADILLSMS